MSLGSYWLGLRQDLLKVKKKERGLDLRIHV
jgi:hypothetical protein